MDVVPNRSAVADYDDLLAQDRLADPSLLVDGVSFFFCSFHRLTHGNLDRNPVERSAPHQLLVFAGTSETNPVPMP